MAQRRTKIEVLNEKISKVDSKIAACTEKIAALEDEKTALAAQLDEIRKAEKKAKEAAELKRLLKLMQKKDISVEDLEAMISREARNRSSANKKPVYEEFFLPNRFFLRSFYDTICIFLQSLYSLEHLYVRITAPSNEKNVTALICQNLELSDTTYFSRHCSMAVRFTSASLDSGVVKPSL